MAWTLDARIPLIVVTDATALAAALEGGGAAVLAEADAAPLSVPAGMAGAPPPGAPHLMGIRDGNHGYCFTTPG